MAGPAGSSSCGLWDQARGNARRTKAYPGTPSLLPPPAESHCMCPWELWQDFLPGRGHGCPGSIPWELQAPRNQAALTPDHGTGHVFRRESLQLCARASASWQAGPRSSAVHTPGVRSPVPSLALGQGFKAFSQGRGSVPSFLMGLLFLCPMGGLVRTYSQ